MRRVLFVPIVIAVCALTAIAGKPRTVDEAVRVLKAKWLNEKDLDWILRNPKDYVVGTLYRPFGTGVRNEFGLWGDNQDLRQSCGTENPEGCSVVIFERLWESVRTDADPARVRELDCQFQLAEALQVQEQGFYKLTTGDVIKALQSQIDEQLPKLIASGSPTCQSSLTLEVKGDPDLHCFVDAPVLNSQRDQPKTVSLETALGGLGFLNRFTSSHVPPRITLTFRRKCEFSTPPYLYGSAHKK
jgi:hypothetical protein